MIAVLETNLPMRMVTSEFKPRSSAWHWFLTLGILTVAMFPLFGAEAPALPSGTAKIFHWRPFLAPFHAVVLHFPIGFVTVAFLLEAYRTFRPGDEIRREKPRLRRRSLWRMMSFIKASRV